jgi:hypothetical protein
MAAADEQGYQPAVGGAAWVPPGLGAKCGSAFGRRTRGGGGKRMELEATGAGLAGAGRFDNAGRFEGVRQGCVHH